MWVLMLLLLAAFVIWFLIEPRMIWPGFLLTFLLGAALMLLPLLAVNLPSVGPLDTVATLIVLAFAGVIALSPVLAGLFLCVNFFIMWRKEGLTTATKISGVVGFGSLAFMAAAITVAALQWETATVFMVGIGLPIAALALGFICFLVYSTFYAWFFGRFGRPVDAVVVLGGALRGGRTVSPLLAKRVDRGLVAARAAWDAGRQIPVVMSGGQGADEHVPEAQAMAEYAGEKGVSQELVLREDRSTTTAENLRYSAELLRAEGITGPVAVATNDYHAFRSATMMRRVKLPGYAVGYPTARYYWPAAVIREYVAVLRDHKRFVAVMLGISALPLAFMLAMLALGLLRLVTP